MKVDVETLPANTADIATSLNLLLADEHVLYIKSRRAHWNIEGHDFLPVHRFFEEQYIQLEKIIDNIAERIRTIGHVAEGTLGGFLQQTRLADNSSQNNGSETLIKWLLHDHETIINYLREDIEQYHTQWSDPGTGDFITGILKTHEKMAWMLRAHINFNP
jgi:starvation-inducible DNA-binding protein